jgi:hypothetical protein
MKFLDLGFGSVMMRSDGHWVNGTPNLSSGFRVISVVYFRWRETQSRFEVLIIYVIAFNNCLWGAAEENKYKKGAPDSPKTIKDKKN